MNDAPIPPDIRETSRFCAARILAGISFKSQELALEVQASAVEFVAEALMAERERAGGIIDQTAGNSQKIRLHCGELSAQEMRAVRAAMHWLVAAIRKGSS